MSLRILTAAVLLAAAAISVQTSAQAMEIGSGAEMASSISSSASTDVAYGDLNLSQPQDAKILADRLQIAAKSVCVKANPGIASPFYLQQCIDQATDTALSGIEESLEHDVHSRLYAVRTSLNS